MRHGLVRVWCYVDQPSAAGDGPLERVVVAKVIVPATALPGTTVEAIDALGGGCCEVHQGQIVSARPLPKVLMTLLAAGLALCFVGHDHARSHIAGDHLWNNGCYCLPATTFIQLPKQRRT